MKNVLVTGGAGFIGSGFVRLALKEGWRVDVLDALTYAGHLENLSDLESHPRYRFIHGDICDFSLLEREFQEREFDYVVNFAAETHVDNSISGPQSFVTTNVLGTFHLLEACRGHWLKLEGDTKSSFRFLHVSTDEVFGELGDQGKFSEDTPYSPNSPYSASKAGGDHLVRAWHETYGLPTLLTNCSNNYGPRQFPEKLIPVMIDQALAGEPLPVYGKGENVRDWIHVEDHCQGILLTLLKARPGSSYCFGGNSERKNLDVVHAICDHLNEIRPRPDGQNYREQIQFVTDRPGHDWRYAIDDSKAEKELGFQRTYQSFEEGLKQTIDWYLANESWIHSVKEKK